MKIQNMIKTMLAVAILSSLSGCAAKHEVKFSPAEKASAMSELNQIYVEANKEANEYVTRKIAHEKKKRDRKIKAEVNLVHGVGVRGSKDPVSAYYNNVHEFEMSQYDESYDEQNARYAAEMKFRINVCKRFGAFVEKYSSPVIAKPAPYGGSFWYLDEFRGFSVEPEYGRKRHPINSNRASSMVSTIKMICEGVKLPK